MQLAKLISTRLLIPLPGCNAIHSADDRICTAFVSRFLTSPCLIQLDFFRFFCLEFFFEVSWYTMPLLALFIYAVMPPKRVNMKPMIIIASTDGGTGRNLISSVLFFTFRLFSLVSNSERFCPSNTPGTDFLTDSAISSLHFSRSEWMMQNMSGFI
jgi:hypothetical protein